MYTVIAYQIAAAIQTRECRNRLDWQLLFSDSDELFYRVAEAKFFYIFQYGMVSFFNMSTEEIEMTIGYIKPFCRDFMEEKISEEVPVVIQTGALKVEFEQVILPEINEEMVRLVMLNASQSVALNRYSEITEELLVETNQHTQYLETNGKLDISGNKLKRFIGKVLNIKNKISENFYIFDSPEITWENQQLNKLNYDLKQSFDLKDRYNLIHDRIEIIKENLELFKDIMDHNESSRLEWIIIILIVIEVVDLFIAKLIL